MKLGTLIEDPVGSFFDQDPTLKRRLVAAIFEFQYDGQIAHTFAYNLETKADRNDIPHQTMTPVPIPHFRGHIKESSKIISLNFQCRPYWIPRWPLY